mmetsp:Transcript_18075/g.68282  ORF Transcript_18075/g.68282 Transcript_18075/m.68282 type:complete len:310 (+) Transcript_18075:1921-2850(+)
MRQRRKLQPQRPTLSPQRTATLQGTGRGVCCGLRSRVSTASSPPTSRPCCWVRQRASGQDRTGPSLRRSGRIWATRPRLADRRQFAPQLRHWGCPGWRRRRAPTRRARLAASGAWSGCGSCGQGGATPTWRMRNWPSGQWPPRQLTRRRARQLTRRRALQSFGSWRQPIQGRSASRPATTLTTATATATAFLTRAKGMVSTGTTITSTSAGKAPTRSRCSTRLSTSAATTATPTPPRPGRMPSRASHRRLTTRVTATRSIAHRPLASPRQRCSGFARLRARPRCCLQLRCGALPLPLLALPALQVARHG